VAIAPGPFLVPVTSLLLAGRLIARFGGATVIALGIVLFAAGMAWWAAVPGLAPSMAEALIGMVILGVAVGLTYPTLMGAGTSALRPSSFATGSGILNMTRQTALALGVAIFVAMLGTPHSPVERLAAYERTWWVMAALTLVCLVPLALLRQPRSAAVAGAHLGRT
jgi:MFS family permease